MIAPRRLVAAAACVAALALCGCVTAPPDIGGPWTSGRMNLRVAASPDRAAQSLTAAFELRGSGQRGELRLLSPIGTQLASARWAPGSAQLVSAEGTRQFQSLEELSREALGEPLPLAALPDWLRGKPWLEAPSKDSTTGFEQLGWSIVLARLAEGFIEATRNAAPAVQLRVQLDRND